ncbi:MAG TPA: thiamine pyrophosphate-dependent enzyme, partial [Chitinophagales bacterium]|nr:thiamine pyrophosphate-dependent enzyme [Chitinophagales bacterium]
FQFAALKQLPIIFLVQDNEWGISVSADESRSMNAYQYAAGFVGLNRITLDGTDFAACYKAMQQVIANVRQTRQPILVHASVPLLNHHTSGVRKEWYRTEDDLNDHRKRDPLPKLFSYLLKQGQFPEKELTKIANNIAQQISIDFENVVASPDPLPETIMEHIFAPTPITTEQGERSPANGQKTIMVDAALHAIDEIMRQYPDAVFYGQDVGRRLGGVFREAATLAEKYGDNRVFNAAIQGAYIVGSTIGMAAVGLKPIVEIKFADYYYTAMNQTVVEMAKSCYLSCGKFPIQALIRVPIGAYGSGGPYHSGSIESTLATIKGIKVVYPSNAADLKGLLKAAFLDPNPVIMLEHKGLYWSKVPGTEAAKSIEPDENYIIPIGVANIYQAADAEKIAAGQTAVVITYGMGVHWALNASKQL